MNDIISPHFSSSLLTWVSIFLQLMIAANLISAYIFRKNQSALYIGVATLFIAFGYLAVLSSVYLYPANLAVQGWYANVVGELLWYAGYSIFSLVIISSQFKRIPILTALVIFLIGAAVVAVSAYYYQPPTLELNGNYNFHRLFIVDFLPFMYGVFLTVGLGKFFLSIYTHGQYRMAASMIVIGIGLVAIFSQMATVIADRDLIFLWQILAIVGMALILIGLWWASIEQKKD